MANDSSNYLNQKHILIVDEELGIRSFLEELFSLKGYRATAVASGDEALSLSRRQEYDLLITGLTMRRMSGWDITRQLKERHPQIPVIVMTGLYSETISAELNSIGAKAILPKPFNLHELLALVSQFTNGSRPEA